VPNVSILVREHLHVFLVDADAHGSPRKGDMVRNASSSSDLVILIVIVIYLDKKLRGINKPLRRDGVLSDQKLILKTWKRNAILPS